MKQSLIFLDIDGVLNTHDSNADRICGIHRDKIDLLNILVQLSGADIVISSAWRYMILNGAMTLDGFRYMLVTHGLRSFVKIAGHTKSDEQIDGRGRQIEDYLKTHAPDCENYVVLDDGSDDEQPDGRLTLTQAIASVHAGRWVKVDGRSGLRLYDVNCALVILNGMRVVENDWRPTTHPAT